MSTTRRDRTQLYAAVFAALLIALFVGRASSAAFTAKTDANGNTFTTGNVALSDNKGAGMFVALGNMVPGATETQCVIVTYNGTLDPGVVKVYSNHATLAMTDSTPSLAAYLKITIDEGTNGTCFTSGSVLYSAVALSTFHTASFDTYAEGAGTWNPTADGQTRAYNITVTLDAATPNTLMTKTVSNVGIVWETQSA